MSPLAIVGGLTGAMLLLLAGYLAGVKRGRSVRTHLEAERAELQDRLGRLEGESDADVELRRDVERLLAPLVRREKMQHEMSTLTAGNVGRGDLVLLLDGIAETGGFLTVLLSDVSGLPLATNTSAEDIDRLGGVASIVFLLAERVIRDGGSAPAALLMSDSMNRVTLHRIFSAGNKRLLLTAVTSGRDLGLRSLDPALVRLEQALIHVPTE